MQKQNKDVTLEEKFTSAGGWGEIRPEEWEEIDGDRYCSASVDSLDDGSSAFTRTAPSKCVSYLRK